MSKIINTILIIYFLFFSTFASFSPIFAQTPDTPTVSESLLPTTTALPTETQPTSLPSEVEQKGITSRIYIPMTGNTTLVVTKTPQSQTPVQTVLVRDYLSSTRLALSEQGIADNSYTYYPYGSLITNSQYPTSNSSTDKLFTGHRKLDGLTVYQAGSRFYSPTLGIFIQPDVVEGVNKYCYTYNNPILLNDPSGNCPWCVGAVVGGVMSAGLDIAVQRIVEKKSWSQIDKSRVVVAAATGAVGGAVGAGLVSNAAKIATLAKGAQIAVKAGALAADVGVGATLNTADIMSSPEGQGKSASSVFKQQLVYQTAGVAVGGVGGRVMRSSESFVMPSQVREDLAWVSRMEQVFRNRPDELRWGLGARSSDVARRRIIRKALIRETYGLPDELDYSDPQQLMAATNTIRSRILKANYEFYEGPEGAAMIAQQRYSNGGVGGFHRAPRSGNKGIIAIDGDPDSLGPIEYYRILEHEFVHSQQIGKRMGRMGKEYEAYLSTNRGVPSNTMGSNMFSSYFTR